jgi:hypothetical protein
MMKGTFDGVEANNHKEAKIEASFGFNELQLGT